MSNPSPAVLISDNGGSFVGTTNGVSVGAGDTITAKLNSTAGVTTWTVSVVGTDDTSSPPSITVAGSQRIWTAGAGGTAVIFQSTVNNGVDGNGVPQPSYTTTFKVYVLGASGRAVIATGETFEGNSTNGWIAFVNGLIRSPGNQVFGQDVAAVTGTTQKVQGFQQTPLQTSPVVGQSKLYIYDSGPAWFALRQATPDDLGPAFTPTLVQASGGAGPFEVGQTFTPTFTPTPLGNAANLTAASVSDNQGNGPVSFLGSSGNIAAPVGGGTYTITSPGTVVVTGSWQQTSPSVTKTASATGFVIKDRTYWGVGGAGATSATYSTGNANLSGGSSGGTTLTGGLVSAVVQSASPALAPAVQKLYFLCRHTATPHTFQDQNGLTFPMNAPTTFNMTNGFGLSISMDLYESTNLLNLPPGYSYTITVES